MVDIFADSIITAANLAGPTLRLEQHDAIRNAVASSHWRSGKSLDSLGADGQEVETVKEYLTVSAGVKDCLTIEPVSPPYKFNDSEVHLCWACGALPCDGGLQSWEKLPWVVTMKSSGGTRFLIDSRDPENRDMFSGFRINADGKISQKSLTTGEGGRYNYHRSYFMEDLPA